MSRKCFLVFVAISLSLFTPGAQLGFADDGPKPFGYAIRGLFIGSLSGFSAGHLRYEGEENSSENITKSVAYGALLGTGIGLTAGIGDYLAGQGAGGDQLLRFMNIGGFFGLAMGTIWGGIDTLNRGDSKALARGAAWGYLGGVVLGSVVAIYRNSIGKTKEAGNGLTHSFALLNDSNSNLYPVYKLDYRF